MPKRTLALVIGLIVLTVILLLIAFNTGKKQSTTPQPAGTASMSPAPTIPAYTVLSFAKNPVPVSGTTGSVDIVIDTDQNEVNAIQLEIAYDPSILSNVNITANGLFANPLQLLKQIDPETGRITFEYAVPPSQKSVKGKGTVATMTFTKAAGSTATSTEIQLLPDSLATAVGVSGSVLKSTDNTTIQFQQ